MNDTFLPVRHPDPRKVVHLGTRSKFLGYIVTACNGRTMAGYVLDHDTPVTCKRCAKIAAEASA